MAALPRENPDSGEAVTSGPTRSDRGKDLESACKILAEKGGVHESEPRRLLRQPGGFEGTRVIAVVAAPDHAVTCKLPDQPLVELDRDATRFSGCGVVEQTDDTVITSVDQPFEPKRELVEVLGPGAHELGKSLTAPIDTRARELLRGQPLAIGGVGAGLERTPSGIAPRHAHLETFPPAPHYLDLLLRHRPRSISRRGVPLSMQGGGFEITPLSVEGGRSYAGSQVKRTL